MDEIKCTLRAISKERLFKLYKIMAEPTFNVFRGEGFTATILYAVIYNVLSSYGVVLRTRFAILNCVGRNMKGYGRHSLEGTTMSVTCRDGPEKSHEKYRHA